jgi:cytochrome b
MKILVWDIPTRLFHWLFAAAFAVAYLTAESEAFFPLHVFSGALMLLLVGFRLAWGLMGSRYARFSSFRFRPKEGAKYFLQVMTGRAPRHIGHNPAGSLAIYALLLLGAAAALFGLATLLLGESFKEVHEALANAMLGVVALHLAGVAVESLVHRENLVKAMVDGTKEGQPEEGIPSSRVLAGVVLLVLLAGWGALFVSGYDSARQTLSLPFSGKSISLTPTKEEGHHHH